MKRYAIQIVGTLGALLAMQTMLWEYARMAPTYLFIVTPWSIRGHETVHGWIVFSIGLLILVALYLVASPRSGQTMGAIALSVAMAVGGTLLAVFFGGGTVDIDPGFGMVVAVTIVVTYIAYKAIIAAFAETVVAQRFWLRTLLLVMLLGGSGIGIEALIGGRELVVEQWVAVGAIFLMLLAISLAPDPRQLAANRMLMLSSLAGAVAVAMSAGAVRSTLVRMQTELDGVAGTYRETQVTSGHLMAVLGLLLVFAASVGLWARRRDAFLNAQRVQRQRQAAEASAAEMEAARNHSTLAG